MANSFKDKELKRRWPVVSGLEAVDKHEGRKINLVPSKGSLVEKRFKGDLID